MLSGLQPPKGMIRLVEARERLIRYSLDTALQSDGDDGAFPPGLPCGQVRKAAAQRLRDVLLEGRIRAFLWLAGKEPVELNLREYHGIVQPDDGTVFTLAYLRPPQALKLGIPQDLVGRLPFSELLLEEAGFRRWLGKSPPVRRRGRQRNDEAREEARKLVEEGLWSPTGTPGKLNQLLNQRGRLAYPVSRETSRRIALEFGYRPRPRSVKHARNVSDRS